VRAYIAITDLLTYIANNTIYMNTIINKIQINRGDITKVPVDAIVNAANTSLMGGGGVDGAIHGAGGPAILEECRKIVARQGGCKTGEAVITTAGNLPAKFVIHTVGPVWNGNYAVETHGGSVGTHGPASLLRNCYLNSLKLAVVNGCKTISFPNISTGVYGYPKVEAAEISVKAVSDFLSEDHFIERVLFVCFDEENFGLVEKEIMRIGL
jgi:O-acetyl-ADP-ribose deacetylase (regulator of RNase III)